MFPPSCTMSSFSCFTSEINKHPSEWKYNKLKKCSSSIGVGPMWRCEPTPCIRDGFRLDLYSEERVIFMTRQSAAPNSITQWLGIRFSFPILRICRIWCEAEKNKLLKNSRTWTIVIKLYYLLSVYGSKIRNFRELYVIVQFEF